MNPFQIEEIIAELNVPARLVNIALVQLELADKITINFTRHAVSELALVRSRTQRLRQRAVSGAAQLQ